MFKLNLKFKIQKKIQMHSIPFSLFQKVVVFSLSLHPSTGQEPMAVEPDMALLVTAPGSLAHRKIRAQLFSFPMKHPLLKRIHEFSCIYG